MRILHKEGLRLGLAELGFFTDDQQTFERLIGLPDGILLVTGPTGSGKTTTLYAVLNYINRPDRKIITVEAPVEYQLSGINQVHVRSEIGLTFGAALRSILRQAPNIIMIGEIRDMETAEIAVNAWLTGHLVFSTLHTNDAPSAITRLIDIGVKPLIAQFTGVARRFERKGERDGVRLVDDYAHHPSELAATLQAVRVCFPDARLVVAFQPHLYSRTRTFAGEFGEALLAADVVVLLPIYAAREQPLKGVSSDLIASAARRSGHRDVVTVASFGDALDRLGALLRPGDVLLTIGPGNVVELGERWLAGGAA